MRVIERAGCLSVAEAEVAGVSGESGLKVDRRGQMREPVALNR